MEEEGEREDFGNCASRYERCAAISWLLTTRGISAEDRARLMLNVYYGLDIEIYGGYPPDMIWDFFPNHVVVADLDDCKDRAGTLLRIYDKAKLCKLAAVALSLADTDEDGHRLVGDDRLDAIEEFFREHVGECECPQ